MTVINREKIVEIDGDLIKLAKAGEFDAIAHGCNCFCRMQRGIAPKMAEAFGCDKFALESYSYMGDINKLGQIDVQRGFSSIPRPSVIHYYAVVNCYTQYHWQGLAPFDYEAFVLCMRKMNKKFIGRHIGLPKIGAGLAGGDWSVIIQLIQQELKDCRVTIVNYKE